jgi:6-phosphofructokinase 1
MDMTSVAVANAGRLHLECLVCLGGNGTQKNAWQLHRNGGLHVLTLPKTIDNDVAMTDVSFGFDTALTIAAEAIDRLHTTATSHHRIIVCELMGHSAGWLALGAGIAGGADAILIPEIPYDIHAVADFILARRHSGKRFSIVAMAEGALSVEEAAAAEKAGSKATAATKKRQMKEEKASGDESGHLMIREPRVNRLARELQSLTGIEARTTSLGHVQRGGTPTPTDRLLCTRLGTMAGELLAQRHFNIMVGVKGDACVPVPLEKVAGVVRSVPPGHAWLHAATQVGTCLGTHNAE